mmetsp:Transcript_2157/g.3198  ORF Transcript_2157/g.3198 Transcript_2157/m.3198 type:complete len:286 (+) Transcript_2157:745-1602(+)
MIVGKCATKKFRFSSCLDFSFINSSTEFRTKWFCLEEKTVVFVGRLCKTCLVRFLVTSLTERHNRVRDLNFCSHEVLLKILQTNLQVQFSRCRNNVFTRLFGVTQNHRIRLCQTLHTLDKFWKIGRVLWFHSTTHNRRDRELHCLDGTGIIHGTNGTGFQQVLVNTDKSTSVSSWYIRNLLSVTTHHDDSTLDVLNPEFCLLTRDIVRSHDTDLLTSGNRTREHTSKCVETSLITCWNHFRNVHTQWRTHTCVTLSDSSGSLVIKRTIIQSVNTVLLCLCWRRKV